VGVIANQTEIHFGTLSPIIDELRHSNQSIYLASCASKMTNNIKPGIPEKQMLM